MQKNQNRSVGRDVADETPVQTTVLITPSNKLWSVYAGGIIISKLFILKSTAIAAAIKYVATHPEGSFSQIEVKGNSGNPCIYWSLATDEFPPKKNTA